MKFVNINGSKVGLGIISVPTKAKYIREALIVARDGAKAQIIAKNNDGTLENSVKFLDTQVSSLDEVIKFLTLVLRLSKKQAEKLEDTDMLSLMLFFHDVYEKLLGNPAGQESEKAKADYKS